MAKKQETQSNYQAYGPVGIVFLAVGFTFLVSGQSLAIGLPFMVIGGTFMIISFGGDDKDTQ